jgi:hypothetical protein
MTSVEVNIDDSVDESSGFVAFDTESASQARIMEIKINLWDRYYGICG